MCFYSRALSLDQHADCLVCSYIYQFSTTLVLVEMEVINYVFISSCHYCCSSLSFASMTHPWVVYNWASSDFFTVAFLQSFSSFKKSDSGSKDLWSYLDIYGQGATAALLTSRTTGIFLMHVFIFCGTFSLPIQLFFFCAGVLRKHRYNSLLKSMKCYWSLGKFPSVDLS